MKEDKIDYGLLLRKAFKYWYVYILFLALLIAAALAYLHITPKKYEIEAMLLIRGDDRSGPLKEEALFKELGLGQKEKLLENEVFIIRSTPLIAEVVKNLELQYRYIGIDGFKRRDLYHDSPIEVVSWQPAHEGSSLIAQITPDQKGGYQLVIDKKEYPDLPESDYHKLGEFGKVLSLPMGKLTLSQRQKNKYEGVIEIQVFPIRAVAQSLKDEIKVEALGEKASVLRLSLKDQVPERGERMLTALIEVYNQKTVDDKNEIYENSIDLINDRISLIAEELNSAELEVENYKQRFSLMELSAEGSLIMKELSTYNREISETNVELEILRSTEQFLITNQENFEFVPTNLGLTNLTLNNQLARFNELLSTRERMRNELGPAHPDLMLTEKQITNLRQTIIDNIRSIKTDLQLATNADRSLRGDLESKLQSLPRRERELVEKERRKDIKESIYEYLLKKREESALSLAVTTATGDIIEPASSSPPVSPRSAQILLISVFLGLVIPSGLVFLKESMNDKVESEEDVTKATKLAVAGVVGHSPKQEELVVQENTHTVQAELFRLLRTNLAYIAPGQQLQSILITSSMAQEGKSFIALNLGVTQAMTGKKVLILELDLRKPNSEKSTLLYKPSKGVVNYLIDNRLKPKHIIHNSGVHPNLDIISCGPKPPNPGELILSERLRELMEDLKQTYDFIIVDTPPVGLVADALQLGDLVEASMYVVRTHATRKIQLEVIRDIAEKNKLPRPFIVLNDMPINKRAGKYYAYYD